MTSLSSKFKQNTLIRTFREFQYFTGHSATMPTGAFQYSTINAITLPANVTGTGNDAFSQSNLGEINFHSNIKTVGANCFLSEITGTRQIKFTKLVLNEGLTSIGNYAFRRNSYLDKIVLPSTLTSLGSGAFWQCRGSNYIVCKATTPPTIPSTYACTTNTNCPIYVPDDSLSVYQSASQWSTYKSRMRVLSRFPTDFPDDAEELGLV